MQRQSMSPSANRRMAALNLPFEVWIILAAVAATVHSSMIASYQSSSFFAFAFTTPAVLTKRSAPNGNLLRRYAERYFHHNHNEQFYRYRCGKTILYLYGHDSSSERDNDNSHGVVSLTIQRELTDATPYEARNAWIEYHWNKGGGLPIAILSEKPQDESTPNNDDDGTINRSTVDNNKKKVIERTILPVSMKERGEYDESTLDAKSLDLHYKVTEPGPFYSDIIPGSHSAVVTFDSTDSENTKTGPGCIMTWNVTFATARWCSFYETMTKWTVGTAATTVQEVSLTPRLLSMTTTIDGSKHAIDSELARKECLEFIINEGGGLMLPPPIPYGDVLNDVGGSTRQNLLRIPPVITESFFDTKTSDDMAEFSYRLNNPGWLTFPFLLHTHLGRVRFTSNASSDLIIDWEVEIRPYQIASTLVEKLTEMTVSTILRNLRSRLTEPNEKVMVKPPRGNEDLIMGQKSLGTVSKETWLGGVLDAHLSDTRSTMDQTISLFQPWTWGRSGTGDESDCLQFQWIDGHMKTT